MNIVITELTLEQVNTALLRLTRSIQTEQNNFETKVAQANANLTINNKTITTKYDDSALRILIGKLQEDFKSWRSETIKNTASIQQLEAMLANVDFKYDENTKEITLVLGDYEKTLQLIDTTYTFSYDDETCELTITDDITGTTVLDEVLAGTTYTFSMDGGILTIHNNLTDTDTSFNFDDRYYTEAEIKALILDKIPPQATAQNQLADKAFVNSSIATSTANFQGTVTSTAALALLPGDDNDYAYLENIDSVTGQVESYDRYKWVESGGDYGHWKYEYTLNNSSYTAEQWAAINSGITCSILECILAGCYGGGSVDVYCGSTCKCHIDSNNPLRLCSNAFKSNATISTTTYPGACCTGTVTGIKVYCGLECKCTVDDSHSLYLSENAFNENANISTTTYPGACCTGTLTNIYIDVHCAGSYKCTINNNGLLDLGCNAFSNDDFVKTVTLNGVGFTGTTSLTASIKPSMCYSTSNRRLCVTLGDQTSDYITLPAGISCTGTVTQVKVGTDTYDPVSGVISLPAYTTPNNPTISIYQGSVCKGSFTLNQATDCTITLDEGANDYCYVRYCNAVGSYMRPLALGPICSCLSDGDCCQVFYNNKLVANPSNGRAYFGDVSDDTAGWLQILPDNAHQIIINDTAGQQHDLLFKTNNDMITYCSIGMGIGGSNVNRGIFHYVPNEAGTSCSFQWLQYWNAGCEIHNCPIYGELGANNKVVYSCILPKTTSNTTRKYLKICYDKSYCGNSSCSPALFEIVDYTSKYYVWNYSSTFRFYTEKVGNVDNNCGTYGDLCAYHSGTSNDNCFWISYICGIRPVITGPRKMEVICDTDEAPEGLVFISPTNRNIYADVYCGTTCKCTLGNTQTALCLSANAFNDNAQISTSTYPGACCTGTVTGVSLNGTSFSGTGSLYATMKPSLSWTQNTRALTVTLGNQTSDAVTLPAYCTTDCLVKYVGLTTSADRNILQASANGVDGSICPVYFSTTCPLTFNATTGRLCTTCVVASTLCGELGDNNKVMYTCSVTKPSDYTATKYVKVCYDKACCGNPNCVTARIEISDYSTDYHVFIDGTMFCFTYTVTPTCINTTNAYGTVKASFSGTSNDNCFWLSYTNRRGLLICSARKISIIEETETAPEGIEFSDPVNRNVYAHVYCGTTCVCTLRNDQTPLCLSANAFNENAQISTTTYPGACCEGTVTGVTLNGIAFTGTGALSATMKPLVAFDSSTRNLTVALGNQTSTAVTLPDYCTHDCLVKYVALTTSANRPVLVGANDAVDGSICPVYMNAGTYGLTFNTNNGLLKARCFEGNSVRTDVLKSNEPNPDPSTVCNLTIRSCCTDANSCVTCRNWIFCGADGCMYGNVCGSLYGCHYGILCYDYARTTAITCTITPAEENGLSWILVGRFRTCGTALSAVYGYDNINVTLGASGPGIASGFNIDIENVNACCPLVKVSKACGYSNSTGINRIVVTRSGSTWSCYGYIWAAVQASGTNDFNLQLFRNHITDNWNTCLKCCADITGTIVFDSGTVSARRIMTNTNIFVGSYVNCTDSVTGKSGAYLGDGALVISNTNPYIYFKHNMYCGTYSSRLMACDSRFLITVNNGTGCTACTCNSTFCFHNYGDMYVPKSVYGTYGRISNYMLSKADNSGNPTYRLLYEITDWYNAAGTSSSNVPVRGLVGTFTHTRLTGYTGSGQTYVAAIAAYGRGSCPITTCLDGRIQLTYSDIGYQAYRTIPVVLKDSSDKYYLALKVTGSSHCYIFNGLAWNCDGTGTYLTDEICATDSAGTLPSGWTLMSTGKKVNNADEVYLTQDTTSNAYCPLVLGTTENCYTGLLSNVSKLSANPSTGVLKINNGELCVTDSSGESSLLGNCLLIYGNTNNESSVSLLYNSQPLIELCGCTNGTKGLFCSTNNPLICWDSNSKVYIEGCCNLRCIQSLILDGACVCAGCFIYVRIGGRSTNLDNINVQDYMIDAYICPKEGTRNDYRHSIVCGSYIEGTDTGWVGNSVGTFKYTSVRDVIYPLAFTYDDDYFYVQYALDDYKTSCCYYFDIYKKNFDFTNNTTVTYAVLVCASQIGCELNYTYINTECNCLSGTIAENVSARRLSAYCLATLSALKEKKDIVPFTQCALCLIKDTDIVSYRYKAESKQDLSHVGFIADYTNELLSGKNKDSMRINDSVGLLLKAVQELDERTMPLYKKITNIIRKTLQEMWKWIKK